MIYFYGFSFSCFPFPLDVLRIYLGPFSGVTCWWYKFFKNFGPMGGQLSIITTIIIRVSASLGIPYITLDSLITKRACLAIFGFLQTPLHSHTGVAAIRVQRVPGHPLNLVNGCQALFLKKILGAKRYNFLIIFEIFIMASVT